MSCNNNLLNKCENLLQIQIIQLSINNHLAHEILFLRFQSKESRVYLTKLFVKFRIIC